MIHGQLGKFNGVKIIVNDQRYGKLVIRPWKERLFTRPWNPFKKYKEVDAGPFIQDGKIIQTFDTWTMNRKTWNEIEKSINSQP